MRLSLLIVAAVLAATSVFAREPKKKAEPVTPPPAEAFELGDPRMSDPLEEACLASPPEIETYDSRDNLMIARTAGGERVFFHFSGGCTTNTMIFADTIASDNGDLCVSVGEALVFASSYGEAKKCVVETINRWLDDEEIRPEDDY